MASKSEVTLKFCAEAQLGAIIEFVALALHGMVLKTSVGAPAATYVFEENHASKREFTVAVKNSRQRNAEEFKAEVVHVFCALQLLGANSFEARGFSKSIPLADVSTWLSAQKIAPLSGEEQIDERTNLTVSNLEEIWQSLALSEQPVCALVCDIEFTSLFPYADLVAGTYESLRHQSGCEVSLQTRKDGTITAHRVDAPDPVSDLFMRWKKTLASSLACNGTHVNHKQSIYPSDGYRGIDESRWCISKMLGAVPPEHKSRVFDWAAGVINSVDEFHNTRGGVPLPDTFECSYDDVHLTADRNLRFTMRQCR